MESIYKTKENMKVTKFYSLRNIVGNSADFHRFTGTHAVGGVYFWGFSLREDAHLPQDKDELLIWYIGKDGNTVIQRVMQEVAQLIFGGFGTIIHHDWLIANPCAARLKNLQEQQPLNPNVLYKSDGLHVLYDFFSNPLMQPTLDWMKERLILAYIPLDTEEARVKVENELHHIVRTNIFGTGSIKNLLPKKVFPNQTPLFNAIDWTDNEILRDWIIEVNNLMPNVIKNKRKLRKQLD